MSYLVVKIIDQYKRLEVISRSNDYEVTYQYITTCNYATKYVHLAQQQVNQASIIKNYNISHNGFTLYQLGFVSLLFCSSEGFVYMATMCKDQNSQETSCPQSTITFLQLEKKRIGKIYHMTVNACLTGRGQIFYSICLLLVAS